ncbi:MAG TPA: hypothetical protein VJS42_21130 [Steroidobacteraceae bacterium]|nr:hypothetical protein [Steroidobacteraceae bacterium]
MSKLPERYATLEQGWGEWIIDTEPARARLRLAKSDEELRAFYEALQPQMPELIKFIDQYPIEALPADVKNLWWLVSSYLGVAVALEIYGSVRKIPGSNLFVNAQPIKRSHALELLQ